MVNPGNVPVLPERGDAIRADWNHVVQAGGGGIGQVRFENGRVGSIAHFVMPAAAFCPK